jgi:hypothetical protein
MAIFISVRADHLSVEDLAGLCRETVDLATGHETALGALGATLLNTLRTAAETLAARLRLKHKSPLTAQIETKDKERDGLFSDLKRSVKAASQSHVPAVQSAGATLMATLEPFWNINAKPLMTQTEDIFVLEERYNLDPANAAAAATLGLTPVATALFAVNTALYALYQQRLEEDAVAAGPSATSAKSDALKAYDNFCNVVEQTLNALPTAEMQILFNEMNDARRKYVGKHPTPLNAEHTSADPIRNYAGTGAPITPIPVIRYKTAAESITLLFSKDFDVTYKNNINPGEAQCIVHGKGKYTGQYVTTFHIVQAA